MDCLLALISFIDVLPILADLVKIKQLIYNYDWIGSIQ